MANYNILMYNKHMNLFQFVFLLFIAVSLYRVIGKIKSGQLNFKESFVWVFVWTLGGIIIFNPGLSVRVSQIFGIGRGVDLVIYTSIIFLYYIAYKMYLKVDNLQKKLKDISTKIALNENHDKAKSKP